MSNKMTKRKATGLDTPDSVNSDTDASDIRQAVSHFSLETYSKRRKTDDGPSTSELRDFSSLPLKDDHVNRPLWIEPEKGRIIVESFSPSFKGAEDLLIGIAEPQSRVSAIHEYKLTTHSLFAAVSIGWTTSDILHRLKFYCKTAVPQAIQDFIIVSTSSFGKVRLVLKHTKYYIESSDEQVLQKLLRDEVIGACRIDSSEEFTKEAAPKMGALAIPGTKAAAGARQAEVAVQERPAEDEDDEVVRQEREMLNALREDDEEEEMDQVHSFQIAPENAQKVSKRCREINLPLTEEYDFRNDEANANLDIDLKPSVQIRPYQEQALSKMFGNGRARSGIIVLPCGAGKTLVGITAACTVKKGTIVLCTSVMSVVQWRAEFLKWSNIDPSDILVFTADNKQQSHFNKNTGVVIATYNMITQSRSHDAMKILDFITKREWGLMLLDEVHVVPAEMFKKVTYSVASHCKLGLTATLLREDNKIEDLNFLIGPKLYEANWQELSQQGHIARVQCAEVWCPMTPEFYTEYLRANTVNKRGLLFTMNPRKFQACQFLINFHEQRGDKVIVFSDNVYALKAYALKMKRPFIYGGTPQNERQQVLDNFQFNPATNTVFLSKIGDTSLDLPEATCLIQISSHFGSRRQEAQRLGRILRAKRRNDEGFNAFFYSLVSKDTNEMYYATKRQAFLVDQGYAFKVITHLQGIEKMPELAYTTPEERRELLQDVLLQNETAGEAEVISEDLFSEYGARKTKKGARRTAGTLSELSGGQDMAYIEYNKSSNKGLKKKKGYQNSFMKGLARKADRVAAAKRGE
ncbi:DNA repair helicase RAD25 [Coniosporium apollinis]|uniref:DNA 3'-5' helicase n=1 Tax=Coniosporium apollinis TaxID=61459 RepID=A0ABQ9NKP6_9PEZI|nr:DNA repair helicase RAD25 [Coniosporium apollinis]